MSEKFPLDESNLAATTTCTDCRRGHYAMPGGAMSNFPCSLALIGLCACWFCQEPTTPAQDRAASSGSYGEES